MRGRKARGTRVDAPLEELGADATGSMVVVANCQFFGGGMRVAPRAIPSDGLLDVLVFTGPKTETAKTARKMFKGEHVPHKSIGEYLVTRLMVDSDRAILVEADGEVIGTTPATFEVYPEALALKV
jgi:diacylglycerol kinase family enzyme